MMKNAVEHNQRDQQLGLSDSTTACMEHNSNSFFLFFLNVLKIITSCRNRSPFFFTFSGIIDNHGSNFCISLINHKNGDENENYSESISQHIQSFSRRSQSLGLSPSAAPYSVGGLPPQWDIGGAMVQQF